MRAGSLFSGYGGLDMAVSAVMGADTVWHCEVDPAASKVLAHHWPDVPNLGDITTVDWSQVEPVDVLTGGFPCQDVSAAGRRAGLRPGTRSGLWTHMAYAITQLRPAMVVVENVRGLLSAEAHSDMEPCPWCVGDGEGEPSLRALGAVLGDLAVLGYDARWVGVRAADVGAPHARFRIFVVATDTRSVESERWGGSGQLAGAPGGTESQGSQRQRDGHPARDGSAAAPHAGGSARIEQGRVTSGSPQGALGEADRGARRGGGTRPLADAMHNGREGREECNVGQEGGQRSPLRPDVDGLAVDWREYEPAIRQWERILGRPAPCPHEPNTRGGRRLSPAFVEWLMGLPAGHVTAVPGISRNDQLRALGNGVVPQQAALGLHLMADFWQPALTDTPEAVPA